MKRDTDLPVGHGRPGAVRLVELPYLYAVVEGASREADTVKIICGIGYEVGVRVLYQAGLHCSNSNIKHHRPRPKDPAPKRAGSHRAGDSRLILATEHFSRS